MPYWTYITTNPQKTTLYTGMTNDLNRRIKEHYENRGQPDSFAGKFYCYNLIYFEEFRTPMEAIRMEKKIKGWLRSKKEELIRSKNPNWDFLSPP
jgi:putative endonuclease